MENRMADIARIEFQGIMNRTAELRKDIRHESQWQRYRLVIRPELVKAIGDLVGWCDFEVPAGTPETFLGIPVIRDPNVEGWLLLKTTIEARKQK